MDFKPLIGIIMLSLQVFQTSQKAFGNENFVNPEEIFLNYNNRLVNMFDNRPNSYGNMDNAPFILIPDSSFQPMATTEDKLSSLTNMMNKNINNVQPIFKLFDHSKPTKADLKNFGPGGSESNTQFIPELILPPYNSYYAQYPGLYEMQYPQFDSNYNVIEIPNRNLFFPPEANYMDPYFFRQNFNPYKNQPKMNKDVSLSDDETYKVTLKSTSVANGLPEIGLGPVRGFKTNFSGDISKCDMICKCRNVNLKQPAPSQTSTGPYTPKLV